jgi:hypothetical protein
MMVMMLQGNGKKGNLRVNGEYVLYDQDFKIGEIEAFMTTGGKGTLVLPV